MAKKSILLAYYAQQYLRTPAYFNRSLLDTMGAFLSSFFVQRDYVQFCQYILFDEEEVNRTLREEYDWELAPDTKSTWRIGDGTAPFYNYIYYTVAGFTENDTFRSNQIREGMLSRDEALLLVEAENQPRWESMEWYAQTIGFSLDRALATINRIPKLYEQ